MSSACVLVSGGVDSGLLLQRVVRRGGRIVPLYLRCGMRWEAVELYWLRRFLRALRSPRLLPLQVVDLPLGAVYGRHWGLGGRRVPSARSADAAVYLPGRNLLLISVAAIVCVQRRLSTIVLGILTGNPFGDATPRFFSQLASCLSQALGVRIRIATPLAHVRKSMLIRSARAAPLDLTFSCLAPRGRRHCGRCNKCAERQHAFRAARVPDPTDYVS